MIPEIISPGFLLDDHCNLKISSTETLGDSSNSSLQEYDVGVTSSDAAGASTPPARNAASLSSLPGETAVSLSLHSDCDSTDTEGEEQSIAASLASTPSPTTWRKLVEKAPYADEESFSIADADVVENPRQTPAITFICHL